jgi:hypothetical protein
LHSDNKSGARRVLDPREQAHERGVPLFFPYAALPVKRRLNQF